MDQRDLTSGYVVMSSLLKTRQCFKLPRALRSSKWISHADIGWDRLTTCETFIKITCSTLEHPIKPQPPTTWILTTTSSIINRYCSLPQHTPQIARWIRNGQSSRSNHVRTQCESSTSTLQSIFTTIGKHDLRILGSIWRLRCSMRHWTDKSRQSSVYSNNFP